MISIGEGCLFRDKVHLVKMGTAADNPTFWYVFRMVIDWTVPKSSTEMRDIILSYCNESMVFEGANKNFSMLEVDFSHHNSVNLAKENTKKQNRHHPASPMKLSSQYFEQTEYAFVVHALKIKSFTSSSLVQNMTTLHNFPRNSRSFKNSMDSWNAPCSAIDDSVKFISKLRPNRRQFKSSCLNSNFHNPANLSSRHLPGSPRVHMRTSKIICCKAGIISQVSAKSAEISVIQKLTGP